MTNDIFVCHASEDKLEVARPLVDSLKERGFSVWYDEYSLMLGDSISEKIDAGLASCRFGIVILSPSFFSKSWPRRELSGLVSRETSQGSKLVLPVWHEVSKEFVESHSPTLADKLGAPTDDGIEAVVDAIVEVLEKEIEAPGTRSGDQLMYNFDIFHAESNGCPECGGVVKVKGFASESGEYAIGTCENCGLEDYYP